MTVDISKIRPGDKVTLVPLEVVGENFEGFIAVKDAGACPAFFRTNQIAAHHPAPREFQVGDRVFVDKERTPRVIGAVFMDVALLDVAGSPMAFNIRRLTLVEGGE